MFSFPFANPSAEPGNAALPPLQIALEPDDELAAAQRQADSLFAAGQLDQAADLYIRILEKQPRSVEVLYALGLIFKRQGQLEAAIECYRSAAAIRPNAPNIHYNLASALRDAGKFDEAARSYRQVLDLQPEDMEAHFLLAAVLVELEEYQAAAESFRRALAFKPDFPEALSNLGSVCIELGDLQAAEDAIRRALQLSPNYAHALSNLANLLNRKGEQIAAVANYRKAIALEPNNFRTCYNLGHLLTELGDFHGGQQYFRAAIAIVPDLAEAHFALSLNLLATGAFAEGWREYEWRWGAHAQRLDKRSFAQPQWRGEPIRGARIFLYAEQGLGDTIQFSRFVPMVAALGAEVVLEVQPGLERLLENIHPAVQVVAQNVVLDHSCFDWQCPLLSLPLALQIDLPTLPAKPSYLRAEPLEVERWRQRMLADGHPQENLRVGLVWEGNWKYLRAATRSIAPEQLSGLLRTPCVTFYALQKDPEPAAKLMQLAAGLSVINLAEHQTGFSDTAAILANLDLIISVDTGVAHLAAALGKPVWILLSSHADWRWLRNRSDSPWYPSVRLFRQTTAGRWDKVLREVQQKLTEQVPSRKQQALLC